MKVAIFVDKFPVRSQTFVLNQITGLIDLGLDVHIIALHKGSPDLFLELDEFGYTLAGRCIYLEERQLTLFNKFSYRLLRILNGLCHIDTFKPVLKGLSPWLGKHAANLMLASIAAHIQQSLTFDWVVCHFGPNGVLANKLRKINVLSGRIATIFHGSDMSAQKAIDKNITEYKQLFKDSELLLPISDLWRDKLIKLGSEPSKVKVHRMGVNLEHFTYQPLGTRKVEDNISDDAPHRTLRMFTAARFTEKKGLCYAIESLTYLPEHLDVDYQIGGYGMLEHELKSQVVRLGLQDKVTFCGPLTPSQVKAHILEADVFLQPSIVASDGDMEGVPVAIMEAMAVGTPVVSTFHSGIPELITNGIHGLLVNEKDPKAIAAKILQLNQNPALIDSICTQARIRIETVANVRLLNQKFVDLLTYHL